MYVYRECGFVRWVGWWGDRYNIVSSGIQTALRAREAQKVQKKMKEAQEKEEESVAKEAGAGVGVTDEGASGSAGGAEGKGGASVVVAEEQKRVQSSLAGSM